ncbi:polysaccharide lyase family 4 protein [Xylariaceae sp. FL1651]|nr:polysaccharide lyase family 4 protein [Xylariaceae sp. FL1651]
MLANDRFVTQRHRALTSKTRGVFALAPYLILDRQHLLGERDSVIVTPGGATGNGQNGISPRLDCYCVSVGSYTLGSQNAAFKLLSGVDAPNMPYEEFRTLIRTTTPLWTNLITDDSFYAPLPNPKPASGSIINATTMQDTTRYIGSQNNDAYIKQIADYYTMYTVASAWRDQKLVINTKNTYFDAPLHSDLIVDSNVYNYYELRDEAIQAASPSWNIEFYDEIAQYVPNYVPTPGRGSWKARIKLSKDAKNPMAVLVQNGADFQGNAEESSAYQYWVDVDHSYDKVVTAGKTTDSGTATSGENRDGSARDPTHPLHTPEYRVYFGAYNFIDDFPHGVKFHVRESDEACDFNYVHWSTGYVYGAARCVKTAVGNSDVFNASQPYSNLPFVVVVNGKELETYYHFSSCGAAIPHYLKTYATNKIALSLLYSTTDFASAQLPTSVYVQYGALRLELQ